MVKTARRRNTRKGSKKSRSNKKHHANKKKSMKIKKIFLRKNNKRTKKSNHYTAHKHHVKFHHQRGLHNTRRVRFGGAKKRKSMRGGMVSSPAAGPVGYSWQGGNEATWPGVGASHGIDTQGTTMSNHFGLSPNGIVVGGIDPARSTSDDVNLNSSMTGGKRGKRGKGGKGGKGKRGNMKGGFFQEIVNLGRGAQYGVNGGYFDLTGKQQPLSQNPYPTDQPINKTSSFIGGIPPDVKEIYKDANMNAASA